MTLYNNIQPNTASPSYTFQPVEKKFGVLRTLASVFSILAILSVFVTGLLLLAYMFGGRYYGNRPDFFSMAVGAAPVFISGLVVTLWFEVIGQGIKLFVSIEHNQRVQAEYLRRLAEAQLWR
jgi:hypothetical protein